MQHGDRVGYLVFSENQHKEVRPARGKHTVLNFIQQLVAHPAWDRADQESQSDLTALRALMRLRQVTRPGSLVILFSDFRYVDADCRKQLLELARHNDVVMIHTSDPFERELPQSGFYRLTDGLERIDIDSSDSRLRQGYRDRYEQQQQKLERLCRELGLYLIDIATSDDMLKELKSGLGLRLR